MANSFPRPGASATRLGARHAILSWKWRNGRATAMARHADPCRAARRRARARGRPTKRPGLRDARRRTPALPRRLPKKHGGSAAGNLTSARGGATEVISDGELRVGRERSFTGQMERQRQPLSVAARWVCPGGPADEQALLEHRYSAGDGFRLNSPARLSHNSILAPCRFMITPCWMTDSRLFHAQ